MVPPRGIRATGSAALPVEVDTIEAGVEQERYKHVFRGLVEQVMSEQGVAMVMVRVEVMGVVKRGRHCRRGDN